MTQAELTTAVNAALASGQPITAAIHRVAEALLIAELYNAASRGAVIATLGTQASLSSGDQVIIIRSGAAYRASKDLFQNVDGGTP